MRGVIRERDTRELFRLRAAPDGGYFAVRLRSPRFALWGETPLQAHDAAMRAINLASAIEARRAETQGGSVVDESAVPKADAHE